MDKITFWHLPLPTRVHQRRCQTVQDHGPFPRGIPERRKITAPENQCIKLLIAPEILQ